MDHTPIPIEGQILAAINHTYRLASPGVPPSTGPTKYEEAAGFLTPPVAVDHPDYGPALALVGITEEGVILAFRSTSMEEPDTVAALWKGVEQVAGGGLVTPRIKGWPKGARVSESGWKTFSNNFWTELKRVLKQHLATEGEPRSLWIGGHNNGGVLAVLAAMRLHLQEDLTARHLVTYGTPRMGNETFQEACAATFKSGHYRYEAEGDLFPHLPAGEVAAEILSHLPSAEELGMALEGKELVPVGSLRYIRKDGALKTGSTAPAEKTRIQAVADAIQEQVENEAPLSAWMNPHRPGCNFPYFTEVTPDGFCDPEKESSGDEDAQGEQENQKENAGEDWEKGLISNTGCFPLFGWFFGVRSK